MNVELEGWGFLPNRVLEGVGFLTQLEVGGSGISD